MATPSLSSSQVRFSFDGQNATLKVNKMEASSVSAEAANFISFLANTATITNSLEMPLGSVLTVDHLNVNTINTDVDVMGVLKVDVLEAKKKVIVPLAEDPAATDAHGFYFGNMWRIISEDGTLYIQHHDTLAEEWNTIQQFDAI